MSQNAQGSFAQRRDDATTQRKKGRRGAEQRHSSITHSSKKLATSDADPHRFESESICELCGWIEPP